MTYNSAMKRALILVMVLFGCGSPPPTPAEQCTDFVDAVCAKQRICTSASYAQCVKDTSSILACGNAVGVGALYDKCIGDMENKTCAELFPGGALVLPGDCMAVIKF